MFLPNDKIEHVLHRRFHCSFDMVACDPEIQDLFHYATEQMDTTVYVKVLTILDEPELSSFTRFLRTCLRKYVGTTIESLECIAASYETQLVCLACIQHYFA
jgi:hypothetical protein